MKNFIKNYVSIPFIKGLLISISVILILMYVILPGLTEANIVLNVISFMVLLLTLMFVVKYVQIQFTKIKIK
jgi:hypothetical protein